MTHIPTEDIDYDGLVDDYAIADEDDTIAAEELSAETKVIQEIREYCKTAIAEHNSFDVLHLPRNATAKDKIAVFDEMFNHKGLVHHLRQIQQIINNKVREN